VNRFLSHLFQFTFQINGGKPVRRFPNEKFKISQRSGLEEEEEPKGASCLECLNNLQSRLSQSLHNIFSSFNSTVLVLWSANGKTPSDVSRNISNIKLELIELIAELIIK
jgi:hypothetical protein